MSDEQSYYEIALTNRQVVVAFVILLVCLLGTFFAGVWVGRGEAPAAAGAPAGEQAQAEDGAIEELDFFGGGEGAEEASSEPAAEAPATQPRPTPDEPAHAETQPQPSQPQRTPPAEPSPDATGGEGAAIPADSQPRETEPPAPQRQVPARGTPVEGPVVQVFSSADRSRAQEVVDELVDAGQPAYLEPGEVGGRTVFRVRIGPFRDRAEAERVADVVRRRHRLDTLVMSP